MSNNRRVLFIGPLPPPYSGPELSMQQFRESELLNNSYNISFLKTNFRKSNESKGKFGYLMIWNFIVFFSKLFWRLLLFRPNLVYYPITPTQIGWLGRDALTIILSNLVGSKVLIHLRGSHFKLNFQTFGSKAKKIVAFALKKVEGAIVQADYLKDQFEPFIEKSRVSVLYQAMDTQEFDNHQPDKNINGKILVVGHMTKAKGYTDIVKIIPEVAQKFPEVQFCFAGNIRKGERGVFYNQYTGEKITYEDPIEIEQQILNSTFAGNYKNLGIIKSDEKLQHFRTCHFFLSASYSEGFSRALLEAMSMGKPLVYTPVGAHKEVLKENKHGIKVEPGNLNQLKNAIIHLLRNKELCHAIGKNNYEYVRSNFSLDLIIKNFDEIIKRTIKK